MSQVREWVTTLIGPGADLLVIIVLLVIVLALGGASLVAFLVGTGRLRTRFGGKTLWNWLELLVVPAFITLGVALLGGLQACAQQRSEEQRAHQAAVQAYLDEMGQLILDKDRPLGESKVSDEVRRHGRWRC
jgi:uncharacterized membrane protein